MPKGLEFDSQYQMGGMKVGRESEGEFPKDIFDTQQYWTFTHILTETSK